jgi:four helix bundle protein
VRQWQRALFFRLSFSPYPFIADRSERIEVLCITGVKIGMVDLKERTKVFAMSIIRMYASLPKTAEMQVIGKQVLRSGTSVGAHYREGSRARSDSEFVSKLEGGLQELEETEYWLELLEEMMRDNPGKIDDI